MCRWVFKRVARGVAFVVSSAVCYPGRGVLTLISVPLYVRSRSASVRGVGTVFQAFRPVSGWKRAGVAQLVEHLICNQRVGGSNPFASSTSKESENEA
jgi:hypothetical protein